jgi:uncharacterized protein YjbJ (UPF0337 family)
MDWNRVEGNWKQVKGKIKEQWGKLTDDDLDVIAGKQDQLEGKLQQRYGYQKTKPRKRLTTGQAVRTGNSMSRQKAPHLAGLFIVARPFRKQSAIRCHADRHALDRINDARTEPAGL